MNLKSLFKLTRESVSEWIDDYAPSMGAALAYYTVFSIAPLLIIVIAVAGFVFGEEAVQGEIAAQLGNLLGKDGADAVQGLIASASAPKSGLIATVVSTFLLLMGATTVFGELQSALDRIWRVPPASKVSSMWKLLRTRVLSFGLVLGMGFLLLVSLVISAALSAFGTWSAGLVGDWEWLLQLLNLATSLVIETGLFAMIYKIMPRARIAWRDVWIGAAVTAALFEIGKLLIGLYLGKSGVTSGFGAAGSLVVLLVWVYYSAQIFLLGAEFTWLYAHQHGSQAAIGQRVPAPRIPSRSGKADNEAKLAAGDQDAGTAPARAGTDPRGMGELPATSALSSSYDGVRDDKMPFITKHSLGALGLVVTAGVLGGAVLGRWLDPTRPRRMIRPRRWFA